MNAIDTYRPPELTIAELAALDIDLAKLSARRRFIIGAGGLLVGAALGACVAREEAGEPRTSSDDCEREFRVFTDSTGRAVCIPQTPQRIVATHDYNAALQLLSLGAPVVGMVSRGGGFTEDVSRYYDVSEITDIGDYTQPNVEVIAELQPDLIVIPASRDGDITLLDIDEETVELLKETAPVVGINSWRQLEDVMTDYAELVGDAATVSLADQQAEFEAVIAEIQELLGDRWQEVTASVVEIRQDQLGTFGVNAVLPTDILTRVGVSWLPIQREADTSENGGFLYGISFEQWEAFNADLLLVTQFDVPDYAEDPIYQQLPVVQANQAIFVPEGMFYGVHYPNYIATARFLLDELREIENFNTSIVEELPEE